NPRAHLKPRPGDAVTHGVVDRTLPGAWNAGGVAEEDQVESATFGGARHLFEHADIRMMTIDPRTGSAPLAFNLRPGQIERQVYSFFHELLFHNISGKPLQQWCQANQPFRDLMPLTVARRLHQQMTSDVHKPQRR